MRKCQQGIKAFARQCVSYMLLSCTNVVFVFQSDSSCGVSESAGGARRRSNSGSHRRIFAVFWCHTASCIFLRVLFPLHELSAVQHRSVCCFIHSQDSCKVFVSSTDVYLPVFLTLFRDVRLHHVGNKSSLLLRWLAEEILCTLPIFAQRSPAVHHRGGSAQHFLPLPWNPQQRTSRDTKSCKSFQNEI